jgi:hypothetical protein
MPASIDTRIASLKPQRWRLKNWFFIRGRARVVFADTYADTIDHQTAVVHAIVRKRLGRGIYGGEAFALVTVQDVLADDKWGKLGCDALFWTLPCIGNGPRYLPFLYEAREVGHLGETDDEEAATGTDP